MEEHGLRTHQALCSNIVFFVRESRVCHIIIRIQFHIAYECPLPHIALLYIHRRFVARAINLNRLEPLKTKYGASVMAAYRSACLLLSALRSLHGRHPKTTYRQNFFWSGAFSACVSIPYCFPHSRITNATV